MTRILERHDTGPFKISKAEIQGDAVWICRCGLSQSQPFCDGSHKITRTEPPNVLLRYVRDQEALRSEPVEIRPAAPTVTVEATPPREAEIA